MRKPKFNGFVNPDATIATTAAPRGVPPVTIEGITAMATELERKYPRREQLLRIEVPEGRRVEFIEEMLRLTSRELVAEAVGETPQSPTPPPGFYGIPIVEVDGLEHPRSVTVEMDEDEKRLAALGIDPAGCRV